MAVGIEIKAIRGSSKAAKRKLMQVIRKIKNPTQANRNVSLWLLRWVNENFKSQGGKVGVWKPFKIGGRRLRGGAIDRSAKLLRDTDRLILSIQPFHSRRFAGVGSDLDYSITHELGWPERNIPARRMLPIDTDRDVERGIIKIYDAYIRRVLR